jgi:hypothetical protein
VAYVRTTEWIAPFYTHISTGPHESKLFKAWLPVNDETCFTFYIHYNEREPLDVAAIHENWEHKTESPDFRTVHTRANMHLQDRMMMEHANFS